MLFYALPILSSRCYLHFTGSKGVHVIKVITMPKEIDPKLKSLFDYMPGCWGCKDVDSVFMYANEEYGKIIGVKHHLDCIDRTDFDMPCATVECAHLFRAQDKEVLVSQKKLQVLDIHPFSDGQWKAYIFTKTPLIEDGERVIGTIFHGVDITSVNIIDLWSLLGKVSVKEKKIDLISQTSYIIHHSRDQLNLTNRESETIFFILRGKSAKQIAKILTISHRTVEQYIEKLKYKFNSVNQRELIENAIAMGYLNYIPESLFNKQLSIILRENQ